MGSRGRHVSTVGERDWFSDYHAIEYFNLHVATSISEPSRELLDCHEIISLDRAFPDDRHPPTQSSKCCHSSRISFLVSPQLFIPELRSCLGQTEVRAPLMPMPKTSMHKNNRPVFRQYHVWLAGQGGYIFSIAKSIVKQPFADSFFRAGIFAANFRHDFTAFFRGENIRHKFNSS